ncbi:MAG: AsmA family protein [Acidobacteria bacterium]|nr:MAG: AsmA family protein [Acidobacteriota bacterium]
MTVRSRKYLIIAAVVLAVLIILCGLVVPRLVDVNRYRPQVAALLESETGKPARIGRLNLTLFPHLAIQVDGFAMENPKGFPRGDFFNAQRIYALLQAGPLWHKHVVIQSLIVKGPVIHLISNPVGHWNYENPPTPAGRKTTAPESSGPGFSLGTISQVNIEGGQVTIANQLPSGTMGPTYFDGRGLSCQFHDVNINALTAPASSSGRSSAGRIIPASSNRAPSVAHGSFHADSLRFGNIQATSVDSGIQVFPQQAYLGNLALKLAGGTVKGEASSDFSQENPLFSARTSFQKIDVAQLLNTIPDARGKMTGTMEGNLDLHGEAAHSGNPLSGLQGTGKVNIRDGRLPTLQLNRNLLFLVRMAGVGATSGDPASFSSISTDLNLANQQLTSHHITIVSNDLNVDASGILNIAKSNLMNYAGTAMMPARQGGLTGLVANISGATFADGKLSFPFELNGTLDDPKFSLKTGKGVLGGLPAPTSGGALGPPTGNTIQNLMNMFQKKSTTAPPK